MAVPSLRASKPLSLAPLCRILKWTQDEVHSLVFKAKSAFLDPAIHSFHILHIYGARKELT
jgi:hypothetical protein